MKQLSRRDVIKTIALGSAFSNVIGRSWSTPLVYDIRPLSEIQTGSLVIKLADFPELGKARGSVRVSTSPLDAPGQKQVGLFAPVIINRGDNNDFYVMSAECTHEGCTVRRMDAVSKVMVCPCHGSQYAMDGTVIHGPALQSLRTLKYTETDEAVQIEMPDVFYEISTQKAEPSARVQISVLTFQGITYEVFFGESLSSAPQPVPFASTASGALNQTEFAGIDDFANFFVERPGRFGFFQVAMKTLKV